MSDCRKCVFYNADDDEMQRDGQDIAIVGGDPPDNHFCFAFTPIPNGYFEGAKDCPKYLQRKD